MSQISRTYTFSDGTDAFGSQVESEISNIVTTWNNHDAGTSLWTVMNATAIKKGGFTGIIPLQIVQATTQTAFNTTSATFAASGLSVSITPQSTSSKILVLATFSFKNSNPSLDTGFATLERGSTNLGGTGGFFINGGATNGTVEVPASIIYLDSPASVAALTYQVYLRTSASSSTVSINNNVACQAAIVAVELL